MQIGICTQSNFVLAYFKEAKNGVPQKFGDGGKLPPRAILGLKGSAEFALEKADFQKSDVNQLELMLYSDFVVSDTLSFRLGVPVQATLVEQKHQEDETTGVEVEKRTDLRWTVPLTVVTAVSM